MINSVSQVHMVCLATIHYLPCGCLRMSALLLIFSSFQLPDVLPQSGGFCTVQIQTAAVTTWVICPHPMSPSPSLTTQATPASRQLLECSELSPASERPHMPFPLRAMLFPHFPCGSLSASRSLPQRGLLGPFSKLSCISTITSSSIFPASWGPVLSPPSTHLYLECLFTNYSGLSVPQMECQLLQGKDFVFLVYCCIPETVQKT